MGPSRRPCPSPAPTRVPAVKSGEAASLPPVRLVELVSTSPQKAGAANPLCIEVADPGGWQLRVPGELLADLVHAL